jgi:hypothetical protein
LSEAVILLPICLHGVDRDKFIFTLWKNLEVLIGFVRFQKVIFMYTLLLFVKFYLLQGPNLFRRVLF